MSIKLFDAELKIMELLWQGGPQTAQSLVKQLRNTVGWSKSTSYTVIKKCIEKGAIQRNDPNFICIPLITEQQAQEFETEELIKKMYGGSVDALVTALVKEKLSPEKLDALKRLIDELK